MSESCLSIYRKNPEGLYKPHDRFSFDDFFKALLRDDFDHEEALEFILANCSLSTLVFQERIENEYYLSISAEDKISADLADWTSRIFLKALAELN